MNSTHRELLLSSDTFSIYIVLWCNVFIVQLCEASLH